MSKLNTLAAALALAVLLPLGGCALLDAPVPDFRPTSEAPTVPVATADVTTPAATPTPSASYWKPSASATPTSTGSATAKVKLPKVAASTPTWGAIIAILKASGKADEPLEDGYSAIIKKATRSGSKVTLTLDKVKRNTEYKDSTKDNPVDNEDVKWEKVTTGNLLVLADAAHGFRQVSMTRLPGYIKEWQKVSYQLPFTVYTINGKPVALIEWHDEN